MYIYIYMYKNTSVYVCTPYIVLHMCGTALICFTKCV